MSQATRRTSGALVGLLVLGLLVGGCEGGSELVSMAPSETASTQVSEDLPVETAVALGSVTGRLPQSARQQVAGQVQEVVDGWIDAAYLAGDYPRTSFADSWPGFTAGARAEAERDGDLMSNRDLGNRVDGVEATRRRLRLDVLAVEGRPVGVTAHVLLRLATVGALEKRVQVAGRLYLSPGKQGWQVFGYDVVKGDIR